ncbi:MULTISPECIES: thermostable hemolysin [Pseudomonas]|uniref:Thermostable hemolysin n=2 Tax=Pseudomonas TaxID=286 RepID=A0AAX0VZ98_9PSED|nr:MULTISPECIES: thermostable hemolysin [Pseudomonas]MBH3358042.1 thermostable hemolysin [Pseudomonas guariconensis]MCO7622246.1 thermostable hemolysin [Pseudomonas guariconensis]MDM9593945.1 thermostable hemolysin [Pseudomonas guariconensis]MDM9606772.1 thermostable hemolysin [Pseudomonas guariconensis]MDM9611728.1 thermostable hemolysin [Pseudomonas guariconensis]
MSDAHWRALFPLAIGTHAERGTAHLTLSLAGEPDRNSIEHFIHQRFASIHHADVHHYLPELLGLSDSHGRLIAAAGMRLAGDGPLFLERYLDEPVEQAASRLAGADVNRQQVVEVGNLAALSAGSARIMIIVVTWLLAARGLEWVAFTGASTLVNSFHRLGLVPTLLADADPDRLNGERDHWGSYYNQHPHVFAGNIGLGHDALMRAGVFQRLGLPAALQESGHAA